jgi:hypothetical protein
MPRSHSYIEANRAQKSRTPVNKVKLHPRQPESRVCWTLAGSNVSLYALHVGVFLLGIVSSPGFLVPALLWYTGPGCRRGFDALTLKSEEKKGAKRKERKKTKSPPVFKN